MSSNALPSLPLREVAAAVYTQQCQARGKKRFPGAEEVDFAPGKQNNCIRGAPAGLFAPGSSRVGPILDKNESTPGCFAGGWLEKGRNRGK